MQRLDETSDSVQLGMRITQRLADALDGERKRLEGLHPGMTFTRSDVARAALVRAYLPSTEVPGSTIAQGPPPVVEPVEAPTAAAPARAEPAPAAKPGKGRSLKQRLNDAHDAGHSWTAMAKACGIAEGTVRRLALKGSASEGTTRPLLAWLDKL